MTIGTASPSPSVFVTPDKIIAGAGCFARLGEETGQLGMKALIVCGKTALRRSGKLDEAVAAIQDAGVQVEVFDRVEPEPCLDTVEAGRRECQELDINAIVCTGGGGAPHYGPVPPSLPIMHLSAAQYRPPRAPALLS